MNNEKEKEEITQSECEHCGGSGEVVVDVFDEDSHTRQQTGTQKCICQFDEHDEEIEQE